LKLESDALPYHEQHHVITAYGNAGETDDAGQPGAQPYIEINRQRHTQSVLLLPTQLEAWPLKELSELDETSLNFFLNKGLEVVLLGTGPLQRFPHPRLLRHLAAAQLGVEVMSTPAACRTYNILLSEGRKVGAALLLNPA
jgi:uncharacterized protein